MATTNQLGLVEHIVVLMLENRSFDNILGALPLNGQPLANGLSFIDGAATNSNPVVATDGESELVHAFPLRTT